MSTSSVWAFTVFALLLTLAPGADVALILRAATSTSRKQAFLTALGIVAGLAFWGAVTAVGLTVFIQTYPSLYRALTVLGGTYLIYLGLTSLRAHRRGTTKPPNFYTGLITNLLNPKVGIFYLSVLPQFVPPGPDYLMNTGALAGIHGTLSMAYFVVLIFVFGRELPKPVTRILPWVTAAALIGFGIRTLFFA